MLKATFCYALLLNISLETTIRAGAEHDHHHRPTVFECVAAGYSDAALLFPKQRAMG